MEKVIKFDFAHFPKGTIFLLKPEFRYQFNGEDKEFEVDRIFQNGANSFVLQTTTWNDTIQRWYSFNISHVERIIKRGQSEVLLSNTIPNINLWQDCRQAKSKTDYAVLNLTPFILSMIYQHIPAQSYVDLDQAVEALKKQGFVRLNDEDRFYINYLINKKKFKKWLQKNANRFILPIKVALEYETELHSDLVWD
jgi:hypothetical protein